MAVRAFGPALFLPLQRALSARQLRTPVTTKFITFATSSTASQARKFAPSSGSPAAVATANRLTSMAGQPATVDASMTATSALITPSVTSATALAMEKGEAEEGEIKKEVPKVGKRKRKDAATIGLRKELDLLSKKGDVAGALAFYDLHSAAGSFDFQQYNYNILLYLCAAAASGQVNMALKDGEPIPAPPEGGSLTTLRNGSSLAFSVPVSPELQSMAARRGLEILSRMRKDGIQINEAALTSAARLAAAQGEGEEAFSHVLEMERLGLGPRLRSYIPALNCFCKQGNAQRALVVDEQMQKVGVQAGEEELASLIGVCSRNSMAEKVYSLFDRVRKGFRGLNSTTVDTIEEWFKSEGAVRATREGGERVSETEMVEALKSKGGGWHGLGWIGRGAWKTERVHLSEKGVCKSCGQRLETIDLDPAETDIFANSLAKLAHERESRNSEFKRFEEWLEGCGPVSAIVDAANIGLCNQNFAGGGFNFRQLDNVVEAVRKMDPQKRIPLIIVHHKRTKDGPAAQPFAQSCIARWRKARALYTTPTGSNDDWYWLYAAVRHNALLVTNDEMRDHLFQLLGNDFFPRWKERHQVRYSFSGRGPSLHLPPPYSIVIQESPSGGLHIPKIQGDGDFLSQREWLCVTRPGQSQTESQVESQTASENISLNEEVKVMECKTGGEGTDRVRVEIVEHVTERKVDAELEICPDYQI